jgi:hypothetical protein
MISYLELYWQDAYEYIVIYLNRLGDCAGSLGCTYQGDIEGRGIDVNTEMLWASPCHVY